jgi:hypothetical protein
VAWSRGGWPALAQELVHAGDSRVRTSADRGAPELQVGAAQVVGRPRRQAEILELQRGGERANALEVEPEPVLEPIGVRYGLLRPSDELCKSLPNGAKLARPKSANVVIPSIWMALPGDTSWWQRQCGMRSWAASPELRRVGHDEGATGVRSHGSLGHEVIAVEGRYRRDAVICVTNEPRKTARP